MIKKFLNWYKARRMFKHTYRELSSLSNHELKDLGIDRSLITRIAFEAAYGDGRHV